MKKKVPSWIVLMLICVVVAGVLGAVNYITEGPIAERAAEAAFAARLEAFPSAEDFKELPVEEGSEVSEAYEVYVGGELKGYVVRLTVMGCKGPIEIQAGFRTNGEVEAISVGGGSFQETVGLGAKVKEPWFREQFSGKVAPMTLNVEVDTITGASISSGAVVDGVNIAGNFVQSVIGD